MNNLADWINYSKLTLNSNKTKYMYFIELDTKKYSQGNLIINIVDYILPYKIDHVKTIKFLGVIIDHKRIWKSYIYCITAKSLHI